MHCSHDFRSYRATWTGQGHVNLRMDSLVALLDPDSVYQTQFDD
ncbi:uncharacterized protein METZ01_LOCUS101342 [marine metagenome]|uniref:Uncharacterized protein n=1 Tax=marine metagenome TaxID=408172 RepID=A0A381W915_9ZZZZ